MPGVDDADLHALACVARGVHGTCADALDAPGCVQFRVDESGQPMVDLNRSHVGLRAQSRQLAGRDGRGGRVDQFESMLDRAVGGLNRPLGARRRELGAVWCPKVDDDSYYSAPVGGHGRCRQKENGY